MEKKSTGRGVPKTLLAKRLRKARIDAGFKTLRAFCEKHGFEEPAYTSHELGHRNPSIPTIKKYAAVTGQNWRYIYEGINDNEPQKDAAFIQVAAYDVRGSAGYGRIIDKENIKYHLNFRAEWLRGLTFSSPDKLALITVDGDSMEPTLFHEDTALIDTNQTNPKKDGVYFIRYDDQGLFKRIQYNPQNKTVTLISDNPQYEPIQVSDLSSFQIIGRALWTGKRL